MDLKEKIRILPSSPGVYLMKDSLDSIIYVGKSKNLKSRVSSYFQYSKAHSPKVVKLVKNIKNFDYILTDTEFEAFILECRLIKEIKPRYNRMMKTPLSYIYVKINRDFSKIETSMEVSKDDGNFYFGPFINKNVVERALQGIKESLKIQCSSDHQSNSPCLNYSLGLCLGMCFDSNAKAKYKSRIADIFKLLNDTDRKILNIMESIMKDAAEKLDFDTAIKYRDYLSAVKSLMAKEKVITFSEENGKIVLIEYLNKDTFKIFLINGPNIIFTRLFKNTLTHIKEIKTTLIEIILNYFSLKALKSSIEIGRNEIDEAQIIYSYLNTNKNNCRFVVIPEYWIDNKLEASLDETIDSLIKY
ncbi:GIY-YIG nuclease family protein [Candidatus Clostridium radicumherbarum]|uniref:GIY-YIG nuclease family protein n=1 Tax=Candidatus Clostridium radicumherbarum TaxID=3381662 RepID=A0ABW8TP89_9CLOT